MLTRRIDSALSAMADCRACVPDLRDLFAPGAPERAALDEVLKSLDRSHEALLHRHWPQAGE